jgi:hypothetical protein
VRRQHQHSPPGGTRHDPAWLILQHGRGHGVPAHGDICAHSMGAIKTTTTACGIRGPSRANLTRCPCYPAENGQADTPASIAPAHIKALLPIDRWMRPAGSSMSGFRTQAPEILGLSRHPDLASRSSASGRSRRWSVGPRPTSASGGGCAGFCLSVAISVVADGCPWHWFACGFWLGFDRASVVVEIQHMTRGNLLTQEPSIDKPLSISVTLTYYFYTH